MPKKPTRRLRVVRPRAGIHKSIILAILVVASTAGIYTVANTHAATDPQTIRNRILSNAQLYLPIQESPNGCNCGGTKIGGVNIDTFTQGVHEAWCADFVSYVYWKSGFPFYGANGSPNYQRMPGSSTMLNWFQSHQKGSHYYPRTSFNSNNYPPLWGDVVFYREAGGGVDHVGIYSGKNTSGSIFSVDGNWSNGVNYHQTTNWKNNSEIIGWGRIDQANN